ncbi:MAG: hypothetical protein AB8G22_06020 [Saprospiraceae bacterium]
MQILEDNYCDGILSEDTSTNCEDTDDITVTVNPLPTADLGADINTCINQAEILDPNAMDGTPGYTYEWSDASTDPTLTVMVENPATFSVTVTDSKGCEADDEIDVIVPVAGITANNSTICRFETSTLTATGGVSYNWSTSATAPSIDVSPATTTKYYVTVTDANSCTDIDSITINVNQLPVWTATSTEICAEDHIDLTGQITNYQTINSPNWYLGTINGSSVIDPTDVSPMSTQDYVFVGADNNGCLDTVTLTITVNNLPSVTITATETEICKGETVDLTATPTGDNPTFNLNWNQGLNNNAMHTVQPDDNTAYRVTVTDAKNCQSTDVVNIMVDSIAVSMVQNCDFNGTRGDTSDDFFTIDLTATAMYGGISNTFDILQNGAIIGSGTYGVPLTLEWANAAQDQRFLADNSTLYDLTFRDTDKPSCQRTISTTAQPSCYSCPPTVCKPIDVTINRSGQ